jgi:hypothetical protein
MHLAPRGSGVIFEWHPPHGSRVMQGSIQRARFACAECAPSLGGRVHESRNPSGFGHGTRFCHAMFTRHERTL